VALAAAAATARIAAPARPGAPAASGSAAATSAPPPPPAPPSPRGAGAATSALPRAAAAPRSRPPSRPKPPRVFTLEPGRPGEERELAANGVDAYEVALAAGQYLRATVDQRGIDVAVDLFAPDHSRLFEVNSPNGAWGPERVDLVADVTGRYRLEVRAESGVPSGRYLARIDVQRPATDGDRRRAAAERAFFEARGWGGQPPPFWQRAARYEKAVRLFHQVGARDREAYALYRLGSQEHAVHHEREALDLFGDARAIYRAAGNLKYVALCDNEIGRCELDLGEIDRARGAYQSALAGWRRLPLATGRVVTLTNLGELEAFAGRAAAALDLFAEAADGAALRGWRPGETESRVLLGWVLRSMGSFDKSRLAQWRVLQIASADDPWRSIALTEIGNAFLDTGEPWQARPYLERALMLERAGASDSRASTLESLGICYRSLEEHGRALAAYREALAIYESHRNLRAQAGAWINLGAIYLYMQQPQRAGECFVKAQELARAAGYAATAAQALLGMAEAARDRGLLNTALIDGKAAVRELEARRAEVARTDLRRTFVAFNTDAYDFMVEVLMRLDALHPAAGYNLQALQWSEQARARELLAGLAAHRQAAAAGAAAIDPALRAEVHRLQAQIAVKDREMWWNASSMIRSTAGGRSRS
jgi:tetratricopeptide (TPR) repeat protein